MSRIGNRAIEIPKGVTISIKPQAIEVKGRQQRWDGHGDPHQGNRFAEGRVGRLRAERLIVNDTFTWMSGFIAMALGKFVVRTARELPDRELFHYMEFCFTLCTYRPCALLSNISCRAAAGLPD